MLYLKLSASSHIERVDDQSISIRIGSNPAKIFTLFSEELVDALLMIVDESKTEDEIINHPGIVDSLEISTRLYYLLELLKQKGILHYEVNIDNISHAFLLPTSTEFQLQNANPPVNLKLTVSRFAYVRREGNEFILECPHKKSKIVLKTRDAVACVWETINYQHDQNVLINEIFKLLWMAGYMGDPEESVTWEFHDLLFHCYTRIGYNDSEKGATFRFLNLFKSQPLSKNYEEKTVQLSSLPLVSPDKGENSLRHIMERRKSIRFIDDDKPITIVQINELLYRVARTTEVVANSLQDLQYRTFPSAGAIHEIEFYLVVRLCIGLEAGLYHYNGIANCLSRVAQKSKLTDSLLQDAKINFNPDPVAPQCLIILSSRMPRISWKYTGIAYRLTLLNAGVIFQSLYLVATEMNLACCAIGNGNSLSFSKLTGISDMEETSIAEFAISSRAVL